MQDHRLERLIQVGRSLVAELDLETLLTQVLDAAREITGAKYAALGILDERRTGLERFVTSGIDPAAHAAIGDLPHGRGVLGVLIDDPRPVRLHDVSAHAQSYGFPLGHPPMDTFLGVPILVHGSAWGNLYLTEKAGGDFTAEDEDAVVVLADWAAIAISNARLYNDVAARRDELERAVRGLETTIEISRALGGETSLERILELVVKRARALVGARSTVIALAEGDEMVVAKAAGQTPPDIIGSRFEARDGLVVPLTFRDRHLGALAAFDRMSGDGAGFGVEDERLLQAFAASAATAVATAQDVAQETLRRALAASDDERRHWARELHDQTLQDLGALRIFLSSARRADDAGVLRDAMTHAVDQLARTIDELRILITELRPAALDDLGLGPALEALVERLQARTPLQLRLDVALGPGRLDPEVEATAFRIVQEGLTNAVKHARAATGVTIEVLERGTELVVAVTDDGAGFDTEQTTTGFGLLGMTERVALVGGRVEVTSAPGDGTTVTASLPARRQRAGTAPASAGPPGRAGRTPSAPGATAGTGAAGG